MWLVVKSNLNFPKKDSLSVPTKGTNKQKKKPDVK